MRPIFCDNFWKMLNYLLEIDSKLLIPFYKILGSLFNFSPFSFLIFPLYFDEVAGVVFHLPLATSIMGPP